MMNNRFITPLNEIKTVIRELESIPEKELTEKQFIQKLESIRRLASDAIWKMQPSNRTEENDDDEVNDYSEDDLLDSTFAEEDDFMMELESRR